LSKVSANTDRRKDNVMVGRPHKPYHMKLIDNKLHSSKTGEDYVGMNRYAAKVLEIPFGWNSHTIPIWKCLSIKVRNRTFEHEVAEAEKMKKGASYEQGHKEAPHTDPLTAKEKKVSSEYRDASFLWEEN